MATQEILIKIKEFIDQVRPAIQSHAGDIELIDIIDNTIYLKFHGACTNCPMSFYTLKMGIEQQIKDNISDQLEVISVD